ncbi:DeoR family transcriptional regulator [Hoeflea marina]|uniref:DeoR family transcriptional regulator n=1 Tax=Hoeflea marina TaxID=274592 RepID=A0A317PQE1_9HYPH|nr:DeoR/GlpR family DNA-binding transcription regulator [Hoeflea marina]PWW00611.1 DeoR family transcriptional regulator [Hoeflea marina]
MPRVDRIPPQRHAAILEHLRANGAASIQELTGALAASPSTVRRDLDYLAERGYVERTHGGATLSASSTEVESSITSHIAQKEKAAIGRLAVSWVKANMTIIFDSGTTVLEAARAIADSNLPITAVTNDLGIAQILGSNGRNQVIVPGGTLRPGSQTLLGNPGAAFLRGIHVDLAFLGTHAITDNLLTDSSLDLAEVKRAMIEAARHVVVLADSNKFGPTCSFDICTLAEIDEVISDSRLSDMDRTATEAHGVKVSIARVGE